MTCVRVAVAGGAGSAIAGFPGVDRIVGFDTAGKANA